MNLISSPEARILAVALIIAAAESFAIITGAIAIMAGVVGRHGVVMNFRARIGSAPYTPYHINSHFTV
jgi:hypothetical protein